MIGNGKSFIDPARAMLISALIMLSSSLCSLSAEDDWAKIRREIHRDMGSKDLIVQLKAIDRLAGQDNLDAAKFIVDFADKRSASPALVGSAAEILSTYKDESVRKYLSEHIRKGMQCQKFIFDAISKMGIPGTKQIFVDIVTGPRKGNRDYDEYYTISVMAMGSFPEQDDSMVALLVSKLNEKEPQALRRSAAEALGGIRNNKCLSALIPYIGDQVISETVQESAERITGQDFGTDRDKWLKWMAEQGNNVKLAYLSKEEYLKLKEQKRKEDALKEEPIRETSFYGIKLKGRNIYFVLDRSGSMNTVDISGTRLARLKMEMTNIVEKLENSEKNYNFGVYFFGGLLRFPMNGICSNKSKNIDRLKRFLDGVEGYGNTPLKAALTFTFDEVVSKNNIDTIYLLSDGEPTDAAPDEIVSLVCDRNLGKYVRINTVSLGQESEMMKKIAEITRGSYVHVP